MFDLVFETRFALPLKIIMLDHPPPLVRKFSISACEGELLVFDSLSLLPPLSFSFSPGLLFLPFFVVVAVDVLSSSSFNFFSFLLEVSKDVILGHC